MTAGVAFAIGLAAGAFGVALSAHGSIARAQGQALRAEEQVAAWRPEITVAVVGSAQAMVRALDAAARLADQHACDRYRATHMLKECRDAERRIVPCESEDVQ